MRTLDEQNEQSFGLAAVMIRDVKLLWRLVGLVWSYFTAGASIRRDYREREQRGETFFVD